MTITRTQVRFPDSTHEKLKTYAEKHSISMNEAIVKLVAGGIFEDSLMAHEDPDIYLDIIHDQLKGLSIESLKKVMKLTAYLEQMEDL